MDHYMIARVMGLVAEMEALKAEIEVLKREWPENGCPSNDNGASLFQEKADQLNGIAGELQTLGRG